MDEWIVVPRWDRFQHYRNRRPPWIKNYARLLDDDRYLALTEHQALVLHRLWLAYASHDRQLLLTTSSLTRQLGLRVMRRDLQALNHAGFIEFAASKPLATETETEASSKELAKEAEAETEDGASAPPAIQTHEPGGNHTPAPNLGDRLIAEIRDADERTRRAIHAFEQRLPEAALAAALESLRHRRSRSDRRPLSSEARYVVAALASIEREQQAAR